MSFVIERRDTPANTYSFGGVEAVLGIIMDGLPEGATQDKIDAEVLRYVLSDLRKPKKIETVRKHFLFLWPLISPLATRSPNDFDAILLEFAEITTTLG